MPVDGTSIKNDIDNDLANKGYRGVRVFNVISALKKVVDWVRDAVNGNLTTWNKVGTNGPAGSNADGVYRTGKVVLGSNLDEGVSALDVFGMTRTRTRQNNTLPLSSQAIGTDAAIQVMGGGTNNAAFMEFHVPGLVIHQLGVDTDGLLKFRPWSTSQSYHLFANGYNDRVVTNNILNNRKVVFYDTAGNDHQFYGMGLQSGQFRLQIPNVSDCYIFNAGTSPVTSQEVMRVKGDGRVGIGTTDPTASLEVASNNPARGAVQVVTNSFNAAGRTGVRQEFHQAGVARWQIGSPAETDAFVIEGWGGGTYPERVRIDSAGNMGVGINSPTARLDVNGQGGHNQLRLRQSFTPANSADANGQPGQIAWDANYIYVKTAAGWRRSTLTSF